MGVWQGTAATKTTLDKSESSNTASLEAQEQSPGGYGQVFSRGLFFLFQLLTFHSCL